MERIGSGTRLAVIALVTALFLGACSSSDGDGSDDEGGGEPSAGAVSPAAEASSSGVAADSTTAPEADLTGSGPRLAAVGDLVCAFGASPPPHHAASNEHGVCKPRQVARLVTKGDYDAFIPLGDLQYSYGGYWRYVKYWDRYYGDVKNITRPIIGNHEAYNGLFEGYYRYFGKRAHPPKGYYSFNLGDWHVMALNSQMCRNKAWGLKVHVKSGKTSTGFDKWISPLPGGGCAPGDPMMKWAARDLEKNADSQCTLAVFHHPLYRFYANQPLFNPKADQQPLVQLLYENGVDLALNGHHHNYQRWAPMDAEGNMVEDGMASITVGTGGDSYQPVPEDREQPEQLEAIQTGTYGILDLELLDGGYRFEFIGIPGDPEYQDAGTGTCH